MGYFFNQRGTPRGHPFITFPRTVIKFHQPLQMRQGDKHCKQVLFNITQENASVTGSQLTSCHQGGRTAVKRSQREQTTHRDAARFVMLLESLSEKHRSRRRSLKTAKGKKGGLIGTAGREAERGQVQAWPSGAALRAPRERREASESIGKQRLMRAALRGAGAASSGWERFPN